MARSSHLDWLSSVKRTSLVPAAVAEDFAWTLISQLFGCSQTRLQRNSQCPLVPVGATSVHLHQSGLVHLPCVPRNNAKMKIKYFFVLFWCPVALQLHLNYYLVQGAAMDAACPLSKRKGRGADQQEVESAQKSVLGTFAVVLHTALLFVCLLCGGVALLLQPFGRFSPSGTASLLIIILTIRSAPCCECSD